MKDVVTISEVRFVGGASVGGGHRQPPSRRLVGAPLLKTAKANCSQSCRYN